jgi:3-hydroxyisobutyrate dehydrogenase-like beta-hydroxyacid dehydrogenase
MMGLGSAAYIEAIAFGVHAGVDAETIAKALAGEGRWRKDLTAVAAAVAAGRGANQGVKFRELPYFLREAQEGGFQLPLTKVLYDFCAAGERVVEDDKRPAPSFWHELTREKE